jgi:transposase
MAKSTRKIAQHLGGSKGNVLAERLGRSSMESVVVVPIEIGKSCHKALMADCHGSILTEPFEFHSSDEGVRLLHHTISRVCREQQAGEVVLGLEATGHYYKKPAASICELGYRNLFVLNPLSTAQCRKAGLTWSKTDEVDLRAIGQALLSGYGTLYRPEQPVWEDLRQLCRYRRFQVKRQTALKNRTHAMLDSLLPGIAQLEMFKDSHLWDPASLAFLAKYPSVELVSRLRPHRVVEFFRRRRRRLTPEGAHQLIRWTTETFNEAPAAQATRQQILKSLLAQLEELSEQLSQLEIDLLSLLVRIPAVLLLSIDYVGPIRAAELAGEITPFQQYPSSRVLIKAAGLDSTRFQSATRESRHHPISKKGSKNLRYISIHTAQDLMQHNDYFAYFSNRLMERGKSNNCACVATAARFLRVAFSMIRDCRSFQPADGLGVSEDPLSKIEAFLTQRQASDRTQECVSLARRYFQPQEVDTLKQATG